MPEFIVCEVYTVMADNADAAVPVATQGVAYAADSLWTLPHPVHMAIVQEKYGHINPPPPREDAPVEVVDTPPPAEG